MTTKGMTAPMNATSTTASRRAPSKRFHVHVAVDDLPASIGFYTGLFGTPPSVEKPDYAKWMLDDPRINFAISKRGREAGLDHFGIQVDSRDQLEDAQRRLDAAGLVSFARGASTCCYAKSEKSWTRDPQGIAWETFLTTGEATTYGDDRGPASELALEASPKAACCAPIGEPVPAAEAPGSCGPGCC
jgi:catechol 2,3-dioxygenase-like lactoylglutathione lyase family enzyme